MVIDERHVLGLSGGRDSAALAVYMRQNHPEIDLEYFFTDTGKELPEVYEFLVKLEGFLGKPIVRAEPRTGTLISGSNSIRTSFLRLRPDGAPDS